MAIEVAKIGRSIKKRLKGISGVLGGQPDFPSVVEDFSDFDEVDFEDASFIPSVFDDEGFASPLVRARFFFVLSDCSLRYASMVIDVGLTGVLGRSPIGFPATTTEVPDFKPVTIRMPL